MKFLSRKNINAFITILASSVLLGTSFTSVQAEERATTLNERLKEYLVKSPYLGLILNEVNYGPITISDIHFNQGNRLVYAEPGEIIQGKLHYKIDTSEQDFLSRHHLIVGIKGLGAQDCVVHNYSVFNSSSGKGSFTLKAPLEPGLYEVKFSYQEAPTCEEARSVWNNEIGEPSAITVIGLIIVE